jgi:hypothetical protein
VIALPFAATVAERNPALAARPDSVLGPDPPLDNWLVRLRAEAGEVARSVGAGEMRAVEGEAGGR